MVSDLRKPKGKARARLAARALNPITPWSRLKNCGEARAPARAHVSNYLFYVDLEGHPGHPKIDGHQSHHPLRQGGPPSNSQLIYRLMSRDDN